MTIYYLWLALGVLLGLFLVGFSLGSGLYLGYGIWQARADRKLAALYNRKE